MVTAVQLLYPQTGNATTKSSKRFINVHVVSSCDIAATTQHVPPETTPTLALLLRLRGVQSASVNTIVGIFFVKRFGVLFAWIECEWGGILARFRSLLVRALSTTTTVPDPTYVLAFS